MLLYKDIVTGDELVSDSFPRREIENGILWEVQGKYVVEGPVEVDIAANPPEEEGARKVLVEPPTKVVDIVEAFRLQEVDTLRLEEDDLKSRLNRYVKALTPLIPEEKRHHFEKNAHLAVDYLVRKGKDLQVFFGESGREDGAMVFAYTKEGREDPIFLYFADGLKPVET